MTNQIVPPRDGSPRAIRVFVSSTFRDMQVERDELMKRTFPQLRKLCEQRGVTWGDVDLRWGITEEEAAEGRVLPICLAEIERCRPYFIGLLGERYGWVPEEIEPGLIEEQPWLERHLERSVTELEIVHGVLRNPAMADHAFFYLRDPGYVESLPMEARPEFLERPSDEEVERLGTEEAERRAEERRGKLAALKARIRSSAFPVEEDYAGPKALGTLVLRDLSAVIDELYPEGTEPEPLEREGAEHEAFARSRATVYIGRREYFERLDAHVAGGDPPLVVLGESGSGKSALLSNWALGYRNSHPDELVLMHFIGSSPYSTDWAAMLRRILAELARRFTIEDEIPDDPDELRRAFANRLHMAAARGRVVLVLDALNQLEDREGAPDLVWLPPEIPPNVRLILSTLPGRSLLALEKRGWRALRVEPLDRGERTELISRYLRQYARALGPAHLERIAEAPQSANPLYLRALLEELRVWGEYETLGDRIDHYLTAEAIDDLYELILERYEEDYEDGRPGLVGDAMALIWGARRGLSEAELLDLLGSGGEPLPSAQWSPLYLAAERSLASRFGLLGFSHDYLRRAVADRYLSRPEDREAAHLRLADYFDPQREDPRGLDELPWQLVEAGSWQRLYELLADLGFFERAWRASESETKAYWARLEADSPLRLVDAYRPVLDEPGRHGDYLWALFALLRDRHPGAALSLVERQVEHYRQSDDRAGLHRSLANQATTLYARGELEEAMALLREEERICRELGDRGGLQISLGNQAVILSGRGELEEAMALLREKERICRELGDRARLQTSLGNQALILRDRGEPEEAMALHKEEERICRELGDPAGLQQSLGNQALLLQARGELEEAMALYKEQERICRELGDPSGLQVSLGNQALILQDRGEFEEAMALLREQERICRELGHPKGLAISLANRGLLLAAMGRGAEAPSLARAAHQIASEHGLTALAQQVASVLQRLE